MNLPRTLDNEKLDQPTSGPIPQSLKQTAGRQDYPGFSILHIDNYLCYEENENTGKGYILYKIWNISKSKASIGKRGYRFG